jgi:hypothetical protein
MKARQTEKEMFDMYEGKFMVEIDGRRVLVDQTNQRVTILDEEGAAVFHDRIQVAAGSLQGLFSMLDDAARLGNSFNPAKMA